jgi:hypothetical protein
MTMTITKFARVSLASPMLAVALAGGAAAASATTGGGLSNATYFEVSLSYCTPPAMVLASIDPSLTGAAAIVFEDVLIGTYGGNCEAFRAKEVLPRLYLSSEGS